jgi:fatty acid desaturase
MRALDRTHRAFSAPPRLAWLLIFWGSVASALLFFALPSPWHWLMLLGLVPLIHGSHDVLHMGPAHGLVSRFHRAAAETLGYAVQGMNMEIVRPSHLYHHKTGRGDDSFMPDLEWSARRLYGHVRYYANLLFLPAVAVQILGFARLAMGPRRLAPNFPESIPEKVGVAYVRNQLAVVAFMTYALWFGGLGRAVVFEAVLCIVWSLGQNVAHYGLRGPDSSTDRVCARTYLLPWPLNWLTFGSTSHFLHHADMRIPGSELYREDHIQAAESTFGINVRRYYGAGPYFRDLFRQFRGPLRESDLKVDWVESEERVDTVPGRGR